MTVLACAIILLHAVVPHHHHDCANEVGFVFETELNCHCHHDHEGDNNQSSHPFDNCKLADMLSHLVLSTKEDENAISIIKAESASFLLVALAVTHSLNHQESSCIQLLNTTEAPCGLPDDTHGSGHALRAPPICG